MRKFILKRNLPTFQKGSTFILDDDGCLYLEDKTDGHWRDRVMAYHKKTLAHFPGILSEWFEEAPSDSEYVDVKPRKSKDAYNFSLAHDTYGKRLDIFAEITIWAEAPEEASKIVESTVQYPTKIIFDDREAE